MCIPTPTPLKTGSSRGTSFDFFPWRERRMFVCLFVCLFVYVLSCSPVLLFLLPQAWSCGSVSVVSRFTYCSFASVFLYSPCYSSYLLPGLTLCFCFSLLSLLQLLPLAWLDTLAPNHGLLLELSENGQIVQTLHDPSGKSVLSSSEVHDDHDVLYIGSYKERFVAKLKLWRTLSMQYEKWRDMQKRRCDMYGVTCTTATSHVFCFEY